MKLLKEKIYSLYKDDSKNSRSFRYFLLSMDCITVLFLVISSFFHHSIIILCLDIVFGFYMAADYFSRMWISKNKISFVLNLLNIADLLATISFIIPLLGANFTFLRSLRILRLLRSYHLQNRLSQDFIFFKKHKEVILSATNLFVFIFLMTEIVFVTQADINPKISNFIDAMYFTIATLTTTGFGDVTLHGEAGRLLSIVIMIFGVSLFLRLVQTIFRPSKIRFTCESCGLFLHESDAVYCKHCGRILKMPSEGEPGNTHF